MFITKYLLQRQSAHHQKSKFEVIQALLTQQPRRFVNQAAKAVPNQAANISEDFDTLLKKLSNGANSSIKSER